MSKKSLKLQGWFLASRYGVWTWRSKGAKESENWYLTIPVKEYVRSILHHIHASAFLYWSAPECRRCAHLSAKLAQLSLKSAYSSLKSGQMTLFVSSILVDFYHWFNVFLHWSLVAKVQQNLMVASRSLGICGNCKSLHIYRLIFLYSKTLLLI